MWWQCCALVRFEHKKNTWTGLWKVILGAPPPPDKEVSTFTFGISRIVYCQHLILPTRLLSKYLYVQNETTDQVFKCKYTAWFVHHQKRQHKTDNLHISNWNLLPSAQIQTAAPLWVMLVSYHRWVNGPYPSLLLPFSRLCRPCLQPPLLLQHTPPPPPWPSRTHPQDTLHWAPWLHSFHALHSAGPQISLFHSFAIPPYVHYLDLLDARCPFCRTCDVNFCPPVLCLHLLPPLLLSYQFFSFLLSCSFCASPLSSFIASYLSLPAQTPPHLFTRRLFFFRIPQRALLVRRSIHCQHISHGWGVAPHSNVIWTLSCRNITGHKYLFSTLHCGRLHLHLFLGRTSPQHPPSLSPPVSLCLPLFSP